MDPGIVSIQLRGKRYTPALIQQHALGIYQQVVVLKLMPLNNATQITDADRALVKRWYEAGTGRP